MIMTEKYNKLVAIYKEMQSAIREAYDIVLDYADRLDYDKGKKAKAQELRDSARVSYELDREEINNKFQESKDRLFNID